MHWETENLTYFIGLQPNPQYLQGMPVVKRY